MTATGAGGGRGLAGAVAVRGRVAPGAFEEHLAGFEGDRFALVVLLVCPFAPVGFGVDEHAGALGQVLGAGARLGAEHLDGEVVGLIDPFLAVAPAGGGRDAQSGDVGAGGELAQLDVAGEVARQGGGGDVSHQRLLHIGVGCVGWCWSCGEGRAAAQAAAGSGVGFVRVAAHHLDEPGDVFLVPALAV